MQTITPHRRRFYPFGAGLRSPLMAASNDLDHGYPYDGWMVRETPSGRVIKERIKGRRGYRADARAQAFLALEAAGRCRFLGLRDAARLALEDAAHWRAREQQAEARGSASDKLWSAHRLVLRSDPATWQEPWSVHPLDLGHGMVLRDALVRR